MCSKKDLSYEYDECALTTPKVDEHYTIYHTCTNMEKRTTRSILVEVLA